MAEKFRIRRGVPAAGGSDPLTVIATATLIVAVLYFSRDIFIPVALAVLLSFVLAPLVRLLRRLRLRPFPAVLASVLLAFMLIGSLTWLMAAQITELARDLPLYQETMRQKIISLKGAAAAGDAMESASRVLDRLSEEIARPEPEAVPADVDAEPDPLPVVVREPAPGPLETLGDVVEPLLHPFATTGIVLVFVVFILLQREDLRNRFIKLVGTGDLQKTTEALDDAAMRLSRLLLTQLALNACFGLVVGIGLFVIGVPTAALWGILAGILRFVPYVGAVIGAALPIALAAAVDPGWTMLVQTALLFLVVEPIVGHVLEPLAYGRTTGLSPVAIVVAATFWTWLWGPIGLVLATPITVCLVVLGRHVKGLAFIEVLLGDRPVLTPDQLFYQRTLAGDAAEIAAVAEEFLKERSISEYYAAIALPGLRLAQADVDRGVLDPLKLGRIRDTLEEVVDDLDAYEDAAPDRRTRTTDGEAADAVDRVEDRPELPVLSGDEVPPTWRTGTPVLCVGLETALDDAAAMLLADLVGKHGLGARAETADALSARRILDLSAAEPKVVCLCFMRSHGMRLRHAVRRVHRRLPEAEILVCRFGQEADQTPPGHPVAGDFTAALRAVLDASGGRRGGVEGRRGMA